ncbi:ankyrin repeat domain-containing protein SOWAHA-like [Ylistrum balloti]|uniref:ankyrin repeat domain-containing protein SOWAHA-like n=1 Tax=Ylistrum balloti TaxID=509963 RepID=UPI002905D54C|nr:ankyrin repeat domain-containing protein SOWAHA-like [Ylistrum balloti]
MSTKTRSQFTILQGYTPLHLASMHGHEQIIELLVQTFKADPNIRDFSGKKAKQYLPNSASTKAQQMLLSRRLGASLVSSRSLDDSFLRSTSFRKSNRAKAITSLIQTTSAGMRKAMLRTSWQGSAENMASDRSRGLRSRSPSSTPPGSAGPSPQTPRRGVSAGDLMPPPTAPVRRSRHHQDRTGSRESLEDEEHRRMTVPRSESEPSIGIVESSKKTYI